MLTVQNLSCGYGDITAVHDLSLQVKAGEIHGLIGSNGAGKTSTILALAGLLPLREGTIFLQQKNLSTIPAHQRIEHGIALVPEGRRIFADLTVDENLTVGGNKLDRTTLMHNRAHVFDTFPRLAERRRQPAGSLSGGEQQMLAMGRGMMANPKVLLVDELSLGLMPTAVDECYRVLSRLQTAGIAIVLVEQSTERILHAATHITVLESGRMVWSGTGADAIGNTTIVESYLGLSSQ